MLYVENPPQNHKHSKRRHRSARRHLDAGVSLAALRAFTAARLLAAGTASSMTAVALATGSNRMYVAAAAILMKAEDPTLINEVMAGRIPILAAAKMVERIAPLVAGFRACTSDELAIFGSIVGTENIFDKVIVPVLNDDNTNV